LRTDGKLVPGRGLGFFVCFLAITASALDREKTITQFAHQSWGAKAGLESVNGIAQTTDGYLWVATGSGLFRFDGLTFKRWDSRGIPGIAMRLHATSEGSLWVTSGRGNSRYLTRICNGQSKTYSTNDGFPDAYVSSVCERRDGSIWVSCKLGLFKLAGERWQDVTAELGLPKYQMFGLLEDRNENLWLASIKSARLDEDGRLAFLPRGAPRFVLSAETNSQIGSLAEAPDGRIWAAETSRSARAVKRYGNELRFDGSEIVANPSIIIFDRDGALWSASPNYGVWRVRDTTTLPTDRVERTNHLVEIFNQKDGLSADYVNCILEDREGTIWVGTKAGLDCFAENKITSFSIREGLPFDNNLIIQAARDGSVWAAASNQGYMRIKLHEAEFSALGWPATNYSDGSALGTDYDGFIYTLYEEPEGKMLSGMGAGLEVLNSIPPQVLGSPRGRKLLYISAVTLATNGLWLCDQYQGIFIARSNTFVRGPDETAVVLTGHTDKAGRVWLGLQQGGVGMFSDGEYRRYSASDGLFQGEVRAIMSRGDEVWFAGEGGLSRFSHNAFQTLTLTNGLPSDNFSALLQDDAGSLWVGGMSAIVRISFSELEKAFAGKGGQLECEVFDLTDGLRGFVQATWSAVFALGYPVGTKSTDGHLWFSTSRGLAVINPGHIPKNSVIPPVHIQQITAAGKSFERFDKLRFPAGTRSCQVAYAGLSFANPTKVRYKYRLEGYEHDWVDAGTRREAFYSGLRPKKYLFRVTACNNDGIWNEVGDAIEFSIAPAFYETAWFPAICIAAVASALLGLYRLRLRQLTARMNLQLAAEQNERKRIAQELHDTLLQGFTGVGLKLDALTSRLPDSMAEIKAQFRKTLEQTDQYLAEGRRSVWKLRSPILESAGELSKALEKASQRALKGTDIALSLSVQGQARKLKDLTEDNLLRICEEAAANAAKHARPTQVEVTLVFNSKDVQLRIRDNGCGFDTKQAKDGHFGLVGIRERVSSMDGRFSLNSQPGEGTEITVTVDVK
jgi:signal transduction histidine kinase/ligand-binding sensor domain-containing protein